MIFGADDVHPHFPVFIQFAEKAFRGRARSGDNILAGKIGEIMDAGICSCQQFRADDKDAIGKGDLPLPFGAVGCGSALDVHGAVLNQRNPILRSDRNEFHLQVWQMELFSN